MMKYLSIGLLVLTLTGSLHAQVQYENFQAERIKAIIKQVHTCTVKNLYKDIDRYWIRGTYYTGVMGAYQATGDKEYLEQALQWGQKHQWQPNSKGFGSNRLTCTQTWLELYFIEKDPKMIQSVIDWLDSDKPNAPSGAKVWHLEGGRRYTDSLYVGSPALAMLAKATGQTKYLGLMNNFCWDVTNKLFGKDQTDIPITKNTAVLKLRGKQIVSEAIGNIKDNLSRSGEILDHRNGQIECLTFDPKSLVATYRIAVQKKRIK